MKSILVPTDFSSYAQHALNFASQLAKAQSMQIKVLHVVEQASAPYMTAVSTGLSDQLGNVFVLRRLEKAKSHLETLMAQLNKEGITSSYQIKIGNPYQNISAQIKHESCDLIVMGTHGKGIISHALLGSVAERVLRKTHIPLLVVPLPEDESEITDYEF
jgi:nucleotide-binding universal stress UspA family protein